MSLLIQAGATLDMTDDEGDTPLDGALMAPSDSGRACADLLVAAGAKETSQETVQGLVTPPTRNCLDGEHVRDTRSRSSSCMSSALTTRSASESSLPEMALALRAAVRYQQDSWQRSTV